MSVIEDSRANIADLLSRWKDPGETAEQFVVSLLVDLHHYCDGLPHVSFERCRLAAHAQHEKEVKEQADATPLSK